MNNRIKTCYDPKPIPWRGADWSAYRPDSYEAGAPLGRGATEQEAIERLLEEEQMLEDSK